MTLFMTSISTEMSAKETKETTKTAQKKTTTKKKSATKVSSSTSSNQPTEAEAKSGYDTVILTEKENAKYQKSVEKEGRKNNDPAYRKNVSAEDTYGVKPASSYSPKKFSEEQTEPENGAEFMEVKERAQREKVSEFHYGVKAGFNASQFTDNDYSGRYGFTAGVFGEYQFCKRFSIAAELLYTEQGARTYEEIDIKGYWTRREITALNYIDVPVLLKYKNFFFKGVDIMVGGQFEYLIDSKINFREPARFGTADINKGYKDYNVSIPMGVSYTFPNKHIVVDARYVMGMTVVTEYIPDAIEQLPEYKNNNIQITVGYSF